MDKAKFMGLWMSLFMAQASAYEFAGHVDSTLARMEKERDAKCAHIQNFGQEMKCIEKVIYEQKQSGELPGTKQYCETHYLQLDNSSLEAKLTELVKKYDTARQAGDISPRMPGEMEQVHYGVEMECVVEEIKKRKMPIHDPEVRHAVRFLLM